MIELKNVTKLYDGNVIGVENVSLKIEQGEFVFLVGESGSGKSTMLKVISGIYKPTSGVARTQGRVVPLLELGCGFDAELTGRENILLNGAILGYSEEFLRSHLQEIIDYSELGQFIEMPSSGTKLVQPSRWKARCHLCFTCPILSPRSEIFLLFSRKRDAYPAILRYSAENAPGINSD